MNSEINFILGLVDAGLTTVQIKSLRKHFWSDGRIDTRSAAFQTALVTGQDPMKVMMARAAELDNSEKEANKVYLAKEEKEAKK